MRVEPWPHQCAAVAAWEAAGRRGIVEMATGSGKTLVGVLAALSVREALGRARVVVLAPTVAILAQWRAAVVGALGIEGGAPAGGRERVPELVAPTIGLSWRFATYQGALRDPRALAGDLLVADEVHHAAAPEFRRALAAPCAARLGLSATVDGGERERVLSRAIGPRVFTLRVEDAIAEGILPRPAWRDHVVPLAPSEQAEFDEATVRIQALLSRASRDPAVVALMRRLGRGARPPASVEDAVEAAEAARLRRAPVPPTLVELARAVYARSWIAHDSQPKLDAALALAARAGRRRKVIAFTMSVTACEWLAGALRERGVAAWAVHARLAGGSGEVDSRLAAFRAAQAGVVVSPKLLDEGVDVPDAEVGINVASTRSRLQLAQRLGRILRRHPGKRPVFHHFTSDPEGGRGGPPRSCHRGGPGHPIMGSWGGVTARAGCPDRDAGGAASEPTGRRAAAEPARRATTGETRRAARARPAGQ